MFLAKLSLFQWLDCFINGATDTNTIVWAVRFGALKKLEKAFYKLFYLSFSLSVEILIISNKLKWMFTQYLLTIDL